MNQEWVIIVSQEVTGSSKFPHNKVGKFKRFKPWPYRSAKILHRIVYARDFLGTEEKALEKAEQVDAEMFSTYVMGMGKIDHTCVEEYTVILHNVTKNHSIKMSSTMTDIENEGCLYDDPATKCTNGNLGRWKIIKGLR